MADPADMPGSDDIKSALRAGRVPDLERPGWMIFLPGETLKPGSTLWTEDEKTNGVWVKQKFLSASEEEAVLNMVAEQRAFGASPYIQARACLSGLANSVKDPQGLPTPGTWRETPHLDKLALWEEFGTLGRGILLAATSQALSPSKEVRALSANSFRFAGLWLQGARPCRRDGPVRRGALGARRPGAAPRTPLRPSRELHRRRRPHLAGVLDDARQPPEPLRGRVQPARRAPRAREGEQPWLRASNTTSSPT